MSKLWRWLVTISWGILIFYLTTIPDFHPSTNSLMSALLSNGGHIGFFGIFAVLLYFSLPTTIWHLTSNILAVTITSIYGFIIELVQRTIPGRSFSLLDLALDTLGASVFLAIISKYENSRNWRGGLHRGNHR